MSYVGLGYAFGATGSLPSGFDANRLPYCGTIRALQTTLGGLGYDVGKVDGYWGPATQKGAAAFAQAKGISVSGGITKGFCAALQQEWAAMMSPPATTTPATTNGAKLLGKPLPGLSKQKRPGADPSQNQQHTEEQPPLPPKAELSTGVKIGIGVAALGVVGAIAYFATRGRS